MTHKSLEVHLGDNKGNPLRVSKRIAEQKQNPKKQDTVPERALAPKAARKRTTEQKQKQKREKKSAPLNPKQPVKKKVSKAKPTKPKPIEAQRVRKEALQEHERRTANDPLPQDLQDWQPERDYVPPESNESDDLDSDMSTYNPIMRLVLTDNGFFDELWSEESSDVMAPPNLKSILKEINVPEPNEGNEIQNKFDYKSWIGAILSPSFSEGTGGHYFHDYMNISNKPLPLPHRREVDQKWKSHINSDIKPWKPKPDYAEGISAEQLPHWAIRDPHLSTYINPDCHLQLGLPNFLVEYKGEGSMKVAHQQARLDGGVAAEGLYKLYSRLNKSEESCLDQPLVGTLEWNGDVVIGNVHWATKSISGSREVDFHMCRVMCHMTRGIGIDDFLKNRAKARNFRQYFANVRERIFKDLQDFEKPVSTAETYEHMTGKQCLALMRERKMRMGRKNVGEMRQALRDYDKAGCVAGSAATARSDSPASTINRLVYSPDAISPVLPNTSFGGRRTRSGDDMADGELPSKRRRFDGL